MLHNDPKAQRDFADWIALHRQDEREARIRKMAAEYIARMPGGSSYSGPAPHNVMAFPYSGAASASYVLPNAALPAVGSVTVQSIHVEIDPCITGFARQLIAENVIREQLDLQEEPGYD